MSKQSLLPNSGLFACFPVEGNSSWLCFLHKITLGEAVFFFCMDKVGCLPISALTRVSLWQDRRVTLLLLGELSLASHERALNALKPTEKVKFVSAGLRIWDRERPIQRQFVFCSLPWNFDSSNYSQSRTAAFAGILFPLKTMWKLIQNTFNVHNEVCLYGSLFPAYSEFSNTEFISCHSFFPSDLQWHK